MTCCSSLVQSYHFVAHVSTPLLQDLTLQTSASYSSSLAHDYPLPKDLSQTSNFYSSSQAHHSPLPKDLYTFIFFPPGSPSFLSTPCPVHPLFFDDTLLVHVLFSDDDIPSSCLMLAHAVFDLHSCCNTICFWSQILARTDIGLMLQRNVSPS